MFILLPHRIHGKSRGKADTRGTVARALCTTNQQGGLVWSRGIMFAIVDRGKEEMLHVFFWQKGVVVRAWCVGAAPYARRWRRTPPRRRRPCAVRTRLRATVYSRSREPSRQVLRVAVTMVLVGIQSTCRNY